MMGSPTHRLEVSGPFEPEQIQGLRDQFNSRCEQQPGLQRLAQRLVTLAGGLLAPVYEEDLGLIFERGITFWHFERKPHLMPGQPSQCHFNAAKCWEANQRISRIATGYGLCDDGIWRQHSWVVQQVRSRPDPANPDHWLVVETTEARLVYHGYILNREECAQFLFDNL